MGVREEEGDAGLVVLDVPPTLVCGGDHEVFGYSLEFFGGPFIVD